MFVCLLCLSLTYSITHSITHSPSYWNDSISNCPYHVFDTPQWLNLALDMVSLVGEAWTSQTFRSVDQLSVSANCRLRRVFTMKSQPPDTTDDDGRCCAVYANFKMIFVTCHIFLELSRDLTVFALFLFFIHTVFPWISNYFQRIM